MVNMKEVFDRYLNDPIPPKYVFCMFGNKVKTIALAELSRYMAKYRVVNIDPYYKIPVLEYYNV